MGLYTYMKSPEPPYLWIPNPKKEKLKRKMENLTVCAQICLFSPPTLLA